MFRFVFVLSIFLFPLSALPEVRTFPEALVGEWVRPSNNEHGDINIVITKKVENTIHGVMTLTGSSYCTEPIPFKGNGSGDTAFISGDAKIICGYGGKLTGQVTRVSDNFYTGNFAYTWFGITWARGTFRLTPTLSRLSLDNVGNKTNSTGRSVLFFFFIFLSSVFSFLL
jgi:hypothetical protein